MVRCCVGAEKRWKRQTKEVFSSSELQLLYTQILGGAVRVLDLILHAHYMLFNCGFLLRNVHTKHSLLTVKSFLKKLSLLTCVSVCAL